ncbi:MAG: hypothetical protein JSS14_22965 [Proteobacteria bacterium]|nr:hypothetical protein [Pseudomonadota bacterium]
MKRARRSIQEQYGAGYQADLPGDGEFVFICVIRHKHLLALDERAEAAVAEVCNAVGYGCLLHSMRIKPPNEAIFPYIATLPPTAPVIRHLLRVGRVAL